MAEEPPKRKKDNLHLKLIVPFSMGKIHGKCVITYSFIFNQQNQI